MYPKTGCTLLIESVLRELPLRMDVDVSRKDMKMSTVFDINRRDLFTATDNKVCLTANRYW